jgi:hypothetical protein
MAPRVELKMKTLLVAFVGLVVTMIIFAAIGYGPPVVLSAMCTRLGECAP